MITYKEQVMSIVKITKMRLIDSHKPDLLSPLRDVIFIYLANGEVKNLANGVVKRLDLFAESDTSNVDHWNYEKTWMSKEKVLFKHWDITKYAVEIEDDE